MTDLASSLIAFQVGSTYEARSACDYDCVWTFTVVSRTSRFITITDRNGEVRRVGVRVWNGVESASPLGTYSMAPVISAERQVVSAPVEAPSPACVYCGHSDLDDLTQWINDEYEEGDTVVRSCYWTCIDECDGFLDERDRIADQLDENERDNAAWSVA